MDYTIMIAEGDYGYIVLDKVGNKYVAYTYISGYGTTHEETFDRYEDAETRYLEMCKNSNLTPTTVEHDENEFAVWCN